MPWPCSECGTALDGMTEPDHNCSEKQERLADQAMQNGAGESPKVLGDNPKDLLGIKKVSTSVLPAVAVLHASHAMMNGASRYGSFNWRQNKVRATIYLDACERHLMAWREREEDSPDSEVHHLGHAIACLSILLDAQATGNLLDDRPENGQGFLKVLSDINQKIAHK